MQPQSVRDVVALYLDHARKDQAARTYDGRRRILAAFAAAHGDLLLADAKPFHLRLWVDANDRWKSDWTRKGVIGAVQRAFNWAAKLGMIDRNPFVGVSNPEGEPGRAMTDAEFRAMLRSSSVPFRRVLMFLRLTGCRPGECAQIEPQHIDLERGVVVLAKHKTAKTRRDRKPRVIILHPAAQRLLVVLTAQMIPDQVKVFINSRGTPWTRYGLACRMKQLRKKLKLPKDCKTYGLRHKFGSDAILHDVGIKTLAVLMGHTTTRSTERYVHIENALPYLGAAIQQVFNGKSG
jgi:integrase